MHTENTQPVSRTSDNDGHPGLRLFARDITLPDGGVELQGIVYNVEQYLLSPVFIYAHRRDIRSHITEKFLSIREMLCLFVHLLNNPVYFNDIFSQRDPLVSSCVSASKSFTRRCMRCISAYIPCARRRDASISPPSAPMSSISKLPLKAVKGVRNS